MKALLLVAAIAAGCVKQGTNYQGPNHSGEIASYVCVGMETSKRFGSCPGCELDARRITSLMRSRYGYSGQTLTSEKATKQEVVRLLKEGVDRTPEDGLFLFFYSGHGGQEYLGGKEPDGSDRDDEFLCLYDTYMLDDEIWDIVSRCKGRVFLYFDACHSATMYRSVRSEISATNAVGLARALSVRTEDIEKTKGFTFRPEKFISAHPMSVEVSRSSPRILCWSGCKESEYSYGGRNGGVFTTAVVNSWKKGMSYDMLWESAVKIVNGKERTQNPVQTFVGPFSAGVEAFR